MVGQAAPKREPARAPRRAPMRAVPSQPRRKSSFGSKPKRKTSSGGRPTRSAGYAACGARSARRRRSDVQSAFRAFTALVLVVSVLGASRIWLSVQANRICIESTQLRERIEDARYEADMLEVRRTALCSPSRIKTLAVKAMGMVPVERYTYLEPGDPKVAPQPEVQRADAGLASAFASLVDLTAGEAHALLVGDVGLASSR